MAGAGISEHAADDTSQQPCAKERGTNPSDVDPFTPMARTRPGPAAPDSSVPAASAAQGRGPSHTVHNNTASPPLTQHCGMAVPRQPRRLQIHLCCLVQQGQLVGGLRAQPPCQLLQRQAVAVHALKVLHRGWRVIGLSTCWCMRIDGGAARLWSCSCMQRCDSRDRQRAALSPVGVAAAPAGWHTPRASSRAPQMPPYAPPAGAAGAAAQTWAGGIAQQLLVNDGRR